MPLFEIIVQFFDNLLKKAQFKEAEQKDLCKRLLRIWLCRSAQTNLPLLSKDHQHLYIQIVKDLDESTDKALVELERLTGEILIDPDIYSQYIDNLFTSAQDILTQLLDQIAPHLTKEESDHFMHTFTLIKKGHLPSKVK